MLSHTSTLLWPQRTSHSSFRFLVFVALVHDTLLTGNCEISQVHNQTFDSSPFFQTPAVPPHSRAVEWFVLAATDLKYRQRFIGANDAKLIQAHALGI